MTVIQFPAHAYVPSNGREWEIQEHVADYYRRQPCTSHVALEYRLSNWGAPGPWAQSIGATGNMRPDVVVWCEHPAYNQSFMTVVEVKAGTAGRAAVKQIEMYLRYIREHPKRGYSIRGVIAAPSLAYSVHRLPPDVAFRPIRPEWRS